MIDYYNLADNQYHTQIYRGPIGTAASSNIYYWVKPRGITMVHITAIGAGGGGGAGVASLIANAGSGGSGGGSGSITRLTIPAIFLTDSLKITVFGGGAGGTTAGGTTAGNTLVELVRGPTTANQSSNLIRANGGSGGGVGTAAGNVAGGVAGVIVTQANALYQSLGTWVAIAGQPGAASGAAGNAGLSITVLASGLPISGGASGGGKIAGGATSNAGGNVTGIDTVIPTIIGGTSGVTGTSGYYIEQPFFSLGGAGGGANANGTGARGGNGSYGCGGGGGGAGTTGGNGPGGNGGPSIVIITCW
jgi:hypothetical protein